jgi:hypothetical protein
MSHAVLRIAALPDDAIAAASEFHTIWLEQVHALTQAEPASIALVMPLAPYDHADWRRTVARDLARAVAPVRVNVIAGDDPRSIAATLSYLESAPGVTGQYLPLDGEGAGNPLS